MTVEEIKKAIALIDEVDRLQSKGIIDVEEIVSHQEMCDICYELHVLKNELEREGKNIVELPCAIGDNIWEIVKTYEKDYSTRKTIKTEKIEPKYVLGFEILPCETYILIDNPHYDEKKNLDYLGKRIFFTKEEAEKALKERKNDDK